MSTLVSLVSEVSIVSLGSPVHEAHLNFSSLYIKAEIVDSLVAGSEENAGEGKF